MIHSSSNTYGSPTPFAVTSARLNGTRSAFSDRDMPIDARGMIPGFATAPEDHLVTAAQSGDQQAFIELCRRHSPTVKKRILSILRSEEDTEDALQETLLRAYVYLDTFRRTCKFATWITSIGVNTALMILRKRRTRKEVPPEMINTQSGTWEAVDFVSNSPDPESMLFKHQVFLAVRREVKRLRPSLRSVIKQYYGSECSLEDSARKLEISISTAKSRLNRARNRVRRSLGRRGIFDSSL